MKSCARRVSAGLAVAMLLYGVAYGVARWRKCIVMQEYVLKEDMALVRRTGPGWDVRDNWRGRLKNRINPRIAIFFRPLSAIENTLRGFRRPLERPTKTGFSVVFPSDWQTQVLTAAHMKWQDSLVENLGHAGAIHVFALTDIPLFGPGTAIEGHVYQHITSRTLFLVRPPEPSHSVIIDQVAQVIGTMGVNGVSLHPHPSGKMVVILEPTAGSGIVGVPLSDAGKTGAAPPIFDGDRVSWTW